MFEVDQLFRFRFRLFIVRTDTDGESCLILLTLWPYLSWGHDKDDVETLVKEKHEGHRGFSPNCVFPPVSLRELRVQFVLAQACWVCLCSGLKRGWISYITNRKSADSKGFTELFFRSGREESDLVSDYQKRVASVQWQLMQTHANYVLGGLSETDSETET